MGQAQPPANQGKKSANGSKSDREQLLEDADRALAKGDRSAAVRAIALLLDEEEQLEPDFAAPMPRKHIKS